MGTMIQETQADGSVVARRIGDRTSVIGQSGIDKFYSKKKVRKISRKSKKGSGRTNPF